MGDGEQNRVCDTIEDIREQKQWVLDEIKRYKSFCAGPPLLNIDASLPSININFAVINFLRDIMAVLGNLKMDEIRALIIDWLINNLRPTLERLGNIIKLAIKECYTCKINPKIPNWLYTVGFNVELEQIDRDCMFKIAPTSIGGRLLYDGSSSDDMNTFLYETIQNGGTNIWEDPKSSKPIVHVKFIESSSTSWVSTTDAGNQQDWDPRNNVFNIKLDGAYSGKSLTTFINDYMDSQLPLFDLQKVIPATMDLLYGSITSNINLPTDCVTKKIEFEKGLEKMVNNGLDDAEVVVDNTFFEFSSPELKNIKEQVRNNKKGIRPFTECCSKKTASVNIESLTELNDKLSDPNLSNSEKAGAVDKSMRDMEEQTTNNVNSVDVDKARRDFIGNFVNALSIVTTKASLSPKINLPIIMMGYLVENKSRYSSTNEFLKFNLCVIRNILGEILRKLIYELLIPFILKNLKPIIICALKYLLKDKLVNNQLSLESLLVNVNIRQETKDKINKAMGNVQDAAGKVGTALNKVNIPNISDKLNLPKDGKFCD